MRIIRGKERGREKIIRNQHGVEMGKVEKN